MMKWLVVAGAMSSAAMAQQPVDPHRGAAVLAEARAACGGAAWDRLAGWHERGRLRAAGRDGRYELWAGITTLGMAMRTTTGGAVASYAGFDGASSWRVRPTGGVEHVTAAAAMRLHARDAYLSNFGYFMPGRFPATVIDLGARTLGRVSYDVVSVLPNGAESFELWLDHASHHVARIVIAGQTAELSEYRTFDGVCAPTVAVQNDGNPTHATTIHVENVETVPLSPTVFTAPER